MTLDPLSCQRLAAWAANRVPADRFLRNDEHDKLAAIAAQLTAAAERERDWMSASRDADYKALTAERDALGAQLAALQDALERYGDDDRHGDAIAAILVESRNWIADRSSPDSVLVGRIDAVLSKKASLQPLDAEQVRAVVANAVAARLAKTSLAALSPEAFGVLVNDIAARVASQLTGAVVGLSAEEQASLDADDRAALQWGREFIDARTLSNDGRAGRLLGLLDRLLTAPPARDLAVDLRALRADWSHPETTLAEVLRDVDRLLADGLPEAFDRAARANQPASTLPPRKEWDAERHDRGDTSDADGYESSDYVDGWNEALSAVEVANAFDSAARAITGQSATELNARLDAEVAQHPAPQTVGIGPEQTAIIVQALEYADRALLSPHAQIREIIAALTGTVPS